MSYTKIGYIVLAIVFVPLLAILGFAFLTDATDDNATRSESSATIPLLPDNVAVFGSASSASDTSTSNIWFQTNSDGQFRTDLTDPVYNPVFTRLDRNRFGIMRGKELLVRDIETVTTTTLSGTVDTNGMMHGATSDDGSEALLVSYSGGVGTSYTLTDGTRLKSQYIPHTGFGPAVSNDGYALDISVANDEDSRVICTNSFSYLHDLSQDCIDLPGERRASFPMVSFHRGTPELFLQWNTDSEQGWSLYRLEASGWTLTNDQSTWDYDSSTYSVVTNYFTRDGKIYFITSKKRGIVSFPFPTTDTTEIHMDYHDVSDLIPGDLVSVTFDGPIANYVFYRDDNVGAGQYLTSVNIDDPTKHVGPWLIPRELLKGTGYYSFQAIDSIFLNDDATLISLGIDPTTFK